MKRRSPRGVRADESVLGADLSLKKPRQKSSTGDQYCCCRFAASGKRRHLLTLGGFALDTHGGGERIVELLGCLLAGLHQAFEIGGGTA